MAELPDDVLLRLSAQRALWGAVPDSLRAVSAELHDHTIHWRVVFDRPPSEAVLDLLSSAAAEVISDFPSSWTIDEEFVVIPTPAPMEHLRWLVFLRHE